MLNIRIWIGVIIQYQIFMHNHVQKNKLNYSNKYNNKYSIIRIWIIVIIQYKWI